MFTKNKFAQMDSIANLINTILEADTKAKMEELKGNQHKIDKNKNNKIDAQDFKILRGEKKVEESSHQAKTTMKHVKNPTAGEKAAAKDIKPGVAGYRDRIAMLKSAEARGGLKKEEVEQVDEAKEPGFRASYGLGRKGTAAKKPETYGKRVTGKGYDKPENERKAPEGNVAMTSMMPGHDERAAKFLARQAKGTLVKGKAQSAKQMEKEEIDPKNTTTDTLKGREKSSNNTFLSKKVMMDVPDNVKEQVEQVDERTLTAPETAEKERIVKGMKKSLAGFKSRYGERAKSVMYATATKAAKERK
jgi:hypothetical protein